MFRSVIKEEIQVPAHIDYLGELRNFVTKAGKKHGFSDTIINAFKLSIDEAATNIIKHAYRDWDGNIKMRVIIKKNSMTVVLIDKGKYFDPSQVKDPDLKRYVDIGKKGGLGIFIIRKLIDEIDYRKTEEGNELRLTKYRKTESEKKKKLPTPSLPASLKARYWTMAASILTILVVIIYSYFFFSRSRVIFKEFVSKETQTAKEIAAQVPVNKEGELDTYISLPIASTLSESRDDIFRIVVTDMDNFAVYTSIDSLFTRKFTLPSDKKLVQEGLYYYKENGQGIYSIVNDVIYNLTGTKVGTVYYEFRESSLKDQIWALRLKDLQLALLVLGIGYAGIFVLVYLILNPFRKLANWIKELGSGNVKDEIDFEANDEVGEIAKAFSEITDRYWDSQKNLAEQERIQKEMQLAQDIQHTLLPAEVPKLEGYEISAFYEAAKEVGGDYYDFIEVDKDTLGIAVADVSGKGVPGSLIMTMIRTALRTEARSLKSASEVLARVNDFVVKDMKKGMFVTLFYVIIDSRRRRINYASAGHNPMILFRKSSNKTYYLNPRGFPVGISLPDPDLFKKSIESDTIQLAEDDILILYTDGITEAMNNRRELFGEERFLKAIREYGHLSTTDFIEKLKQEIHSFTEGHEQNDDITLVAIKEKSSPEKIELKRAQKAHKMILQGKNIRDACEECGITVYAYYNKYKKIFEEEGVDAFEIDEAIAVEAKHLSIEEKTKIFDIIKKHPEYGAKRISEELNTERYGFTVINENKIYDELVRSRLNTRQLREAFIARSGRKRRMKPPGTPMLTLDGKVIISDDYKDLPEEPEQAPEEEVMVGERKSESQKVEEKSETEVEFKEELPENLEDDFYLRSLMTVPIEELLKKKRKEEPKKSDDEISLEKPVTADESHEFNPEELDESQLHDFSISLSEEITSDIEENDTGLIAGSEQKTEIEKTSESIDETETDIGFENILEEGLEDDIIFEEELAEDHVESMESQEADIIDREVEEIQIPETVDIDRIIQEDGDETQIGDEFDLITEAENLTEEFLDENIAEEVAIDSAGEEETASKSERINEIPDDGSAEIENAEAISSMEEIEVAEDDENFSFSDLLEELTSEETIDIVEEPVLSLEEEEMLDAQKLDFSSEMEQEINHKKKNFIEQPADPKSDRDLLLGLRYYRAHEYELAVAQFLKVIEKYPDYKEVYSILGNAYYHLGKTDEALRNYEKVKRLDPTDSDAYENTGIIFANLGQLDKAIEEWKKVLEIDPERNDIQEHIREAEALLKNSSV